MIIVKKKTRKLRGYASHGHGRIGQHRKYPGGGGDAGGQHHYRINFHKYHSGYFGKVGIYHKTIPKFCPAVNCDRLWSLVSEQTREKYAKETDKAPAIDCVKAGYYKVLGKGVLPKQPVAFTVYLTDKNVDKTSAHSRESPYNVLTIFIIANSTIFERTIQRDNYKAVW